VEPSAPEVISRTADLLDSPPYDDPFYADNPDDDLQGVARIKQRPPEGEWFVWLLMAGRGFGKTRCATAWLNQMVRERCTDGQQVLIAGRTPADVRTFTLKGPGGLLTHYSDIEYFPSRREVVWPNGVVGIIRSGANPEEFRGFSGDYAVLEELAAWQYPEDAWSNLSLGMRESDPRITIATTPRPIKTLKEIKEMPGTVTISGTSFENRDNLAASYITNVLDPLSKTRLGRQEVFAELLEDVPGALWRLETDPKSGLPGINDGRVYPNQVPDLERIVVGVDPQGTKGEGSATGIVVAGISGGGHIYVLADMTINGSPSEWATRVIAAVDKYRADRVVSERNFGGDMVESTIRNVRAGTEWMLWFGQFLTSPARVGCTGS
jgi:phage terminase large subunit-like protein